MSEESTQDETLVTVATFPEPMEARMARMALESAGIAVFLRGENANSMVPVAFESQLQVRATDEAAAREVLQDMETSPPTEGAVTDAEMADEAARS